MNVHITDETLRPILKCFPYILRKKGSKQGIIETILLFLTVLHSDGNCNVDVVNYGGDTISGEYVIHIDVEATRQKIPNLDILDQLLKYIAPTGYVVNYRTFVRPEELTTVSYNEDEITVIFLDDRYHSDARSVSDTDPWVIGGVGTTVIRLSDEVGRDYPEESPENRNIPEVEVES
jgi:hypothetical protein